MKTILDIKNELVKTGGYKSYEDFEDQLTFGREKEIYIAIHLIDEVAKQLAKHAAQKALEDAAEQATVTMVEESDVYDFTVYEPIVDKQSILTTPIIIE